MIIQLPNSSIKLNLSTEFEQVYRKIFIFAQKKYMPKLFEYLGLIIRFFSNEHEPIHIHAFYKECQTKVEFVIENGIITKTMYRKVQGYEMIPNEKMSDLEDLIHVYKYDIVQLWIKYFILHEKVTCKKINVKLK